MATKNNTVQNVKSAEAKNTETKPSEVKSVETEPIEIKITEAKPAEVKITETKSTDEKSTTEKMVQKHQAKPTEKIDRIIYGQKLFYIRKALLKGRSSEMHLWKDKCVEIGTTMNQAAKYIREYRADSKFISDTEEKTDDGVKLLTDDEMSEYKKVNGENHKSKGLNATTETDKA